MRKTLIVTILAFMAMALTGLPLLANGGKGVEVNYLGVNNVLVRIVGDGRYLLLPVQESSEDAAVNVLADGRLDRTIYVRLAKSKVDYFVPLDLAPYRGKRVVLNVVTSQGRSTVREVKEDACWRDLALADTFNTSNREKYRPLYHHTPLYGWMNDPNGMFYKDGEWHLYYQANPYGSKWQNMTWGHSSSRDLITWTHHPAAIEPNGLGTVFSGSATTDPRNTAGYGSDAVIALYTSAGASQIQSLAWSNDNGRTFSLYPGNPVITLESEARDPNMFWNEDTGEWNLVLAHALEHEMLFFASPDLKTWTLRGAFGKGLGSQDGVWECPDLFELPVARTQESKWVLLCNINPGGPFGGSATQYFVGDFDGTTFTPDTDDTGMVTTKWLDFGKDHYATVSWKSAPDNRRTVIGWMSNWQYAAEVPTMQYRSANTLPRELGLFYAPDGQIYASVTPSPEMDGLRDKLAADIKKMRVKDSGTEVMLPAANDGICEILLDINPRKSEKVTLTLKNDAGDRVVMVYDTTASTLSFDRRQSGIVDFSQDFPAVTVAPTFTGGKEMGLRLFIDRSSIEVFEGDGKFAMTNLVFPTKPYTSLSINADDATITNLKIYSLSVN